MTKKKKILILVIVLAAIAAAVLAVFGAGGGSAAEISQGRAQELIDEAFSKMQGSVATGSMKYIAQNSSVTVDSLSYGNEKDIIAECTFKSIDLVDDTVSYYKECYEKYTADKSLERKTSTQIKLMLSEGLTERLKGAEPGETKGEIIIYETKKGYEVYTDDDTVDRYFGGIISAKKKIEEFADPKAVTFTRGFFECIRADYSSEQPDVGGPVQKAINKFIYECRRNFVQNNNWRYIVRGLWVTLRVTFFAVLIGILIGFLVAIIRCTNQKTGKLKIGNAVCRVYLTVVRGTPVLVQLMIIYFVIFMPLKIDKFLAAVVCFGLNSGAYVAEIVRGGIMAVDEGQMEAGRSLGFNYASTMALIIVPQAFKAVLPALANEFIVLLKETSVSAYIGLNDLARGGDIIRGVTFSAFLPLLAVALIYLIMVVILSWLVGKLERRLRNSER